MPAVLKLTGDYDVDEVLSLLNAKPYEVNRKGDTNKRKGKKPYAATTCKFDVSKLGFDEVEKQFEDTITFLSNNINYGPCF